MTITRELRLVDRGTRPSLGPPDHLRPRPLEVACGLSLGVGREEPPLPAAGRLTPRAALEAAILPALRRPPCLVSFSGGRDSSALLAMAASMARREGLDPPVPVTYRFPDAAGSHEDDWQEKVVRHLGLTDWERLVRTDEIDSVGPAAAAVLLRHGLLWPFNAHFHAPLLERAAGGSLVTGVGGDEVLGPQQWHAAQRIVMVRPVARPTFRQVRTVGLALAPSRVQARVLAARRQLRFPWLRPEVEDAVQHRLALFRARTPVRWSVAVGWWWRSRTRSMLSASVDALAAGSGAQLVQPFLDPAVVGAVAAHFGARGPGDRTAAMRALFGDLLPDDVLARRSKVWFDEAFFAEHSRRFVAGWDGRGIDPSLVDTDRLAEVWRSPRPDPRSFLLLQAAWLAQASRPDSKERP